VLDGSAPELASVHSASANTPQQEVTEAGYRLITVVPIRGGHCERPLYFLATLLAPLVVRKECPSQNDQHPGDPTRVAESLNQRETLLQYWDGLFRVFV